MSGNSFKIKVYFVTAKSYFKQCGLCSSEYEVTFMQDIVENALHIITWNLLVYMLFSFFTSSSQPQPA